MLHKHFTVRLRHVCLSVLLTQLTACGLTQPQLSAVRAFADATKDYSSKGSDLLTVDNDVFLARESFQAAAIQDPDNLWKAATGTQAQYARELKLATKLRIALDPLTLYAQELEQFASADFTSANDKAAKNLGDNFNKAISAVNKTFGENLPAQTLGSGATYAIQYVGDIFIRYRQAQETKSVVQETNATIHKLTPLVKSLADTINDGSLQPAGEEFKKSLTALSSSESLEYSWLLQHTRGSNRSEPPTPHILSPTDSMALFQALIKLKMAQEAATTLSKASDACSDAHQKMLEALEQPATLSDAVSEIEAFQSKAAGTQ
jgi:hypothetical protein